MNWMDVPQCCWLEPAVLLEDLTPHLYRQPCRMLDWFSTLSPIWLNNPVWFQSMMGCNNKRNWLSLHWSHWTEPWQGWEPGAGANTWFWRDPPVSTSIFTASKEVIKWPCGPSQRSVNSGIDWFCGVSQAAAKSSSFSSTPALYLDYSWLITCTHALWQNCCTAT